VIDLGLPPCKSLRRTTSYNYCAAGFMSNAGFEFRSAEGRLSIGGLEWHKNGGENGTLAEGERQATSSFHT